MRIAGISIPDNKRLEIGLTAIFGVGRARALEILAKAKVDGGKRPGDVSADEETRIREELESQMIEGDLKRYMSGNVKRLKDIKAYRGMRHARNLPSRGQRTKTNARTLRGARKTMGSGKRKVEKK